MDTEFKILSSLNLVFSNISCFSEKYHPFLSWTNQKPKLHLWQSSLSSYIECITKFYWASLLNIPWVYPLLSSSTIVNTIVQVTIITYRHYNLFGWPAVFILLQSIISKCKIWTPYTQPHYLSTSTFFQSPGNSLCCFISLGFCVYPFLSLECSSCRSQ
jgi:hypothetical protein